VREKHAVAVAADGVAGVEPAGDRPDGIKRLHRADWVGASFVLELLERIRMTCALLTHAICGREGGE
jgi:hypothetical protein